MQMRRRDTFPDGRTEDRRSPPGPGAGRRRPGSSPTPRAHAAPGREVHPVRSDGLRPPSLQYTAPSDSLWSQARQPGFTLVALDLGSCLQLDDATLATVVDACGPTLERLGLRDCRAPRGTDLDAFFNDTSP